MNSRGKYLFKNVGILTISNFASKILVFLLVPLYTSVLSTEDVGIYDLIVSTVALLYPVLTLNIVDGVMRFSMDKANSKDDIVGVALRYIGISWLIGGIGLILIRVANIAPQIKGLEVLIFLYYVFYILYHLLQQFAKGLERVIDMGIAGVIATVAMITGNIVFLLVLKTGLKGFLSAYTIAQILPSTFLFFRLRFWKYLKLKSINQTLNKEMLLYSVPLIATALGWWVNNTSDKYVVALMCGAGANGLLAVGYKIPQILNTLQQIFIQAWQISAIKEYGEKNTAEFYGRAFNFINVLMCFSCSVLIILTKPLGHILYQKDFFAAWQYVPFLIVACVLNSASGFLGPILSAKKDSKTMALSSIYGAVANIIMNVLFVYLIGIQGACIATVISSFIIYLIRRKAIKDDIQIENHIIVLVSWALICGQAVLEIYTPLWWLEIMVLCVMIILNFQNLKAIWKMSVHLVKK